MLLWKHLQATGEFEHAIDMGMAWTGEWYPIRFFSIDAIIWW